VPGLTLPAQFVEKGNSDMTTLSFKLQKTSDEQKMSKINSIIKAIANKTSPVSKSNESLASDHDLDTNGYREGHADTLPRHNRTKKVTSAPKGSLTVPSRPPSSRYPNLELADFDNLGTDFDTLQPKKLFSDRKRSFSSLDVDDDNFGKKSRIDDTLDSGDGEISKMLQSLSTVIESKLKASNQKLVDTALHSIEELQEKIEIIKQRHHEQRVELDSRFRNNLQKLDHNVASHSSKLKTLYEDLKKEHEIMANIKDMSVDLKKNVASRLSDLESQQQRELEEIKREGERKISELKIFIDKHNQSKKHLAEVVHKLTELEYNM